MRFSEALRRRRTRAQLSQSKLAALVPCHATAISHYERGVRTPPPDVLAHLDVLLPPEAGESSLAELASTARPVRPSRSVAATPTMRAPGWWLLTYTTTTATATTTVLLGLVPPAGAGNP